MSKDKIQLLSPLFLKYQADFEKNPRSRVFAPLAETYRKLGMTDKAMEILSQGIRFHPTYVMGYLGLSFCYYDLKQYTLAYSTLRPLVENSRDNIRLQKLFAEVCLLLNYKEEALDTYKYLLFINPRDKEVADQVQRLEHLIEEQYRPVHQPIYIPEAEFNSPQTPNSQVFDIDKLENRPNASKADFDDWMALDLSREQKETKTSDPHDFWNLQKGETQLDLKQEDIVFKQDELLASPVIEVEAENFNNRDYHNTGLKIDLDLDLEDEDDSLSSEDEDVEAQIPLVTHTLVDLYCGQGHIEKALEVLEKILILNPKDQKTINKISEIRALMNPFNEEEASEATPGEDDEFNFDQNMFSSTPEKTKSEKSARPKLSVLKDVSEEDGRKHLMSIFDEQIKPQETLELKNLTDDQEKIRVLEEKLSQFLKKIQKRALDYQARV
jgi:tetratricopeptide (TPR) repeat protein